MSEENIVRYTAEELDEMIARGEDRTDYEHLRNLTDEDIERAVAGDLDADFSEEGWIERAVLIDPTEKMRVTIRLDTKIVDYFKEEGAGYQTRINSVLRFFVADRLLKRGRDEPQTDSEAESASKRRVPRFFPGRILWEEYMKPNDVDVIDLAARIRYDEEYIAGMVRGDEVLTADIAIRLAELFDTTPGFWLNMQKSYELEQAEERGEESRGKVRHLDVEPI